MLNKILATASLIALILLLVMVSFTTPSGIGPFGVLAFFILCYAVCLGVLVALCRLFFFLRNRSGKTRVTATTKKSYYYGSVLAFAPVILLAMRSFGTVGILEISLVAVAMLVACFLVAKRIL